MIKCASFSKKTKCLHIFTCFFIVLFIIACSNSTRTKNVQGYPKNSQPNAPQKPTPNTGLHAPGYAALNLIAIKQTARALDIVLNRKNSKYIHSCQTLTISDPENRNQIITLVSRPQNCGRLNSSSNIKSNTNSNSKDESWDAYESFTVTFDDGDRGSPSNIKTIIKDQNSRATVIERSLAKNNTTIAINLAGEKIEFTRVTEGRLQFNYRANLLLSVTETRQTKEKKNKKTVHASLVASGFVNISNLTKPLWTLTQTDLTYEHSKNNLLYISTMFSLITGAPTENLETVCGLPIGQFGANQYVTINGQSDSYTPAFIIDPTAVISTPGYNVKFQSKTCAPSARNGLRGFQDLIESVLLAEKITNQPSRGIGRQTEESTKELIEEQIEEQNITESVE